MPLSDYGVGVVAGVTGAGMAVSEGAGYAGEPEVGVGAVRAAASAAVFGMPARIHCL